MPPHHLPRGTRDFLFLLGGTSAEKGWEPLIYVENMKIHIL